MDDVLPTLKSCIISRKGGVPLNELDDDFKELTGEAIPYKKLGFNSLTDLLHGEKDITVKSGRVFAYTKESAHISNLINRQRDAKPKPKKFHKFPFQPIGKFHPKKYGNENKENRAPNTNVVNNKKKIVEAARKEVNVIKNNSTNNVPNVVKPLTVVVEADNRKVFKINENTKAVPVNLNNKQNKPISIRRHNNLPPYNEPAYCNGSYTLKYDRHNFPVNCPQNPHSHQNQLFNLAMILSELLMSLTSSNAIKYNIVDFQPNWNNYLQTSQKLSTSANNNHFLSGHQIIGDDFMVDLLISNYGAPRKFTRKSTCMDDLTLRNAQLAVCEFGCHKRAMICCGYLDLHLDHPVEQMIRDMQQLLLCMILSGCKQPVVCTLPPSRYEQLDKNVTIFNNWLCSLTCIKVIHLHSLFVYHCRGSYEVDDKMYHRKPVEIVDDCSYFPLSSYGRGLVAKTITNSLTKLLNDV